MEFILHLVTPLKDLKKFEDNKGVSRSCKSKKDRKGKDQMKNDKGQTTIYKTLHIKLKKEQHEPY